MAKSNGAKAKAGTTGYTAYWQQEWMTKVYSDGCCSFAKLLFVRIASFGERGCWMTNEALGEECNRSERTIRRAVSSLWYNGDLIITGWNNQSRKMYAAKTPGVREKLNRECRETLAKGKIKTQAEYLAKIRLRVKKADPQN